MRFLHGNIPICRTVLRPYDAESHSRLIETENRVSVVPLDEYLGIDKLPTTVTAEMMLWLAWWAQCQISYEKSQDMAERIQKRLTFRDSTLSDDLIRKIVNILGKMVHDIDMALADRTD
jgi:hypothetical protein